jgi:nicotinamide-nucleotide amidase
MSDPNVIAEEIGKLLRNKKMTLGTVESATGGLISHLITDVSGSSDYYKGSVISYSNEIKVSIAGIRAETIERYGAVSLQVAEEMANSGRKLLNVDICVADTGIAGPAGATPGKPVGLFYIGLATPSGTSYRKCMFIGNREENRLQAAMKALQWVLEYLKS